MEIREIMWTINKNALQLSSQWCDQKHDKLIDNFDVR